MLEQMLFDGSILLRNMIQKDPSFIVGGLSSIFGYLLNAIYNFVDMFSSTGANTLGFAIILLTIAAKIIMLPLNIKSHKSMAAMQRLQPEMEKIKAKYSNSKDPEIQRKMNMEVSQLYSKNKANPVAGCLPMFIQFPIFMALYYIMNQPHRFIDKLGQKYLEIAQHLVAEGSHGYADAMHYLVGPKIPSNFGRNLLMNVPEDVVIGVGKFTPGDWDYLLASVSAETASIVEPLLKSVQAIENFFGIITTENTGWSWPSILIPILCVVFTFLTSYLTNKQSAKSTDPSVQMQQTMMMYGMPIMMGFITFGMPAGVGLYWVTSNATQIIQQMAFGKIFSKDKLAVNEIVDPKPAKSNKKNKS